MKKRFRSVFITGGGTGGHVYPAVAIFEKISAMSGKEKIYYIADASKIDKVIADENDMNFLPIKVCAMPRCLSPKIFLFLFELLFGVVTAVRYIKAHRPSVIIGTGGYVSAPALIAGVLCKIPIVLHDSDAYPGMVTRKMAPFAAAVNLAFAEAKKYIKSKNIFVFGNPLRHSLGSVTKIEAKKLLGLDVDKKTVFVMGGSQGAQSINDALKTIVKELVEEDGIQIIHQTGVKKYEKYCNEIREGLWKDFEKNSSYIVKPYFDNMSLPLNAADLVVGRAGSLSISELNLCGIPSILIPYPHAAANHQYHNAVAMQNCGASVCVEDKNCLSINLKPLIVDLIKDSVKLNQMSMSAQKAAKPDAVNDFFGIINQYLA